MPRIILIKIIPWVIAGLILFRGGALPAATGSVWADPPHPAATAETPGTTTIGWTTSGTNYAEVWVSVDGGQEVLFASGASGTSVASWIQFSLVYTFSLYESNTHANKLASTTVTAQPPSPTGTITPNPCHLVLSSTGTLGMSTITWNTTLTTTAQVYVAADGEAEQLFATGKSGSLAFNAVQPSTCYVFTLYEGTAHANLLAWTSVTSQRPPATMLGFNYWPHDYSCDCLTDFNWGIVKPAVAADLDQMASLSCGVLRIMFWPWGNGWILLGADQGGVFYHKYYEINKNLVEFIGMCQERGIKVEICFGNNWFDVGNGTPGHQWWMDSYNTFDEFEVDLKFWANELVKTVEASAYRKNVIYYDYENEITASEPNLQRYLTFLYDNLDVPKGKRGVSVLRKPDDFTTLKNCMGGRRLDYVEFHAYPVYEPNTWDVAGMLRDAKSLFPDSTCLLGEYGAYTASANEEAAQQDLVREMYLRAKAAGVPFHMPWMLWDHAPAADNQCYGWGYEPDKPKDVMGGMAELLTLAPNPDMEKISSGAPESWSAGGTVAVEFSALGPQASDAATNQYCARLKVLSGTGSVWIRSAEIPVHSGRKLFVNSYIRSDMKDISMAVHEYDASHQEVLIQEGPKFTPAAWAMNSYLHHAGSWSVTLGRKTRYAVVAIQGTNTSNPAYLDADTVTVWEQDFGAIRPSESRAQPEWTLLE